MADWNVLFVGLGPLGRIILRDFVQRGLGCVAGVVDIDPSLRGRSAGELLQVDIPGDPRVSGSIEESLARFGPAALTCAVLATASDLARCMPSLRALLGRGVNVVSTCEELLYPWLRHQASAAELESLCRQHGARCVGTGVNPGFMMDSLPVALTAVCRRVDAVRVERHQDASTRRIPFQQKIGASLSDEEFARRVSSGVLRHVGLGESLHFIAKYLALDLADWNETIEPIRAPRPIECALGAISRGGISGVHQSAHGRDRQGREVITLDFRAAIGLEQPRDRIVIEGEPSIESVIPGAVQGDIATSAITLNAIGALTGAAPGLHTMASLPLTHFVRASRG